jgi:hypothetical protein
MLLGAQVRGMQATDPLGIGLRKQGIALIDR